MRPERPLADIQKRYALVSDDRRCELRCAHIVHLRQRLPKHGGIDALLGATALKAGLCLSNTILDSLHVVSAGEGPPRSDAPAFQDDVRVDEDRTGMTGHADSQLHRRLDPVVSEEVGEVVNGQIQQIRGASG